MLLNDFDAFLCPSEGIKKQEVTPANLNNKAQLS